MPQQQQQTNLKPIAPKKVGKVMMKGKKKGKKKGMPSYASVQKSVAKTMGMK